MKNIFLVLLLSLLLSCSSNQKQNPLPDDAYGFWDTLELKENKGVILVPQWHLSPNLNTKTDKKIYPQFLNQMAIYKQSSYWIENNQVQNFLVEGCEGDLSKQEFLAMNSWTLNELKTFKEIENVQTHVGIKLLAKYPNKAKVLCGDNLELIKKHQLALSDIRGLSGFKIRLLEHKEDPIKQKAYLLHINKTLKLKPNNTAEQSLKEIDSELLKSIDLYEKYTIERNASFVQKAKLRVHNSKQVIIIGAIHIKDLKKQLEDAKIPYAIWTPKGIDDMGNNLIEDLKKELNLIQ